MSTGPPEPVAEPGTAHRGPHTALVTSAHAIDMKLKKMFLADYVLYMLERDHPN